MKGPQGVNRTYLEGWIHSRETRVLNFLSVGRREAFSPSTADAAWSCQLPVASMTWAMTSLAQPSRLHKSVSDFLGEPQSSLFESPNSLRIR